ncbi:MAG: Flp pilus assembly complex ATPase component, partial [Armatimonadetes bacterium]|nr:Flp pilus assembly complex ATPase component [Armatimonadota bacterium]
VLRTAPAPPKRLHAAVVSRIKIMSDMDIAERRLPQDGRIALRLAGRQFDVRVSTLPTLHGETVVMRLLDQSSALFGLEELGMESVVLEQFAKVIVHPHGIILVTGPTGSGKTTTLYAALSRIFSPEKKIITIEDPVEYQLEGVNQIHVRPASGLTFASGLRHMVRQDPDIIMVGEIRDHETAEIAIHAALTGHLVFSTLHTNDAAGAVARLLEMGVEPFLAASSLIGVLAQRLVRVICPQCKTTTTVPAETLATLNVPADEAATATLYRGAGCDNCGGTGYQGRRGIFELLTVTSGVRDLIALRATASQLKQKAMGEGMRTLAVSGRDKALAGLTTVEEVLRVAVADEQLEVRS